MKIAFILGSSEISGGTNVIYEHAIHMKNRGIEAYLIMNNPVIYSSLDWYPEAKELKWLTFKEAETHQFNIAIATWWRTVFDLYRVKADKYCYFVQSIESKFYSENEANLRKLVDSTYFLPLYIITEVHWIQKYLKENYGVDSDVVLNGIDKRSFTKSGDSYAVTVEGKLRVLIEGPINVPFKNVKRTIQICRQSKADEIWLLTSSLVHSNLNVDKVYSEIPIKSTPMIYRSCDVLVKLSYVEGMFGPPLEMFHCGGTAVVYNVSGYDEYILHNVNGLVADMGDEQTVLKYINKLKENPNLLKKLKYEAEQTALRWPSWEEASLNLEQALRNILDKASLNQSNIESLSKFLYNWYEIADNRQFHKKMIDIVFPYESKRRYLAKLILKPIWRKIINFKMK